MKNRDKMVIKHDMNDKSITKPSKPSIGKKAKPDDDDIQQIISLIKTCDEANAIEKFILDQQTKRIGYYCRFYYLRAS